MTESTREARRRRILDRGSDRLAFITGQARTLPTPAVASTAENESRNIQQPDNGRTDLDENTWVNKLEEEQHPCEISPEPFETCEVTSASIAHGITSKDGSTKEHPDAAPMSEATVRAAERKLGIFTPNKIKSSISTSENIRVVSSAIIAISVVLSYHGYSVGGNILHSLINFRPLLLLLFTNATIVLGNLLLTWRGDKDEQLTNEMGDTLEIVIVVQKALAAALMDCSIFAVIIICGLVI